MIVGTIVIWRERSIKDSYRRSRLQSSAPIGLEMRVAITFVLFAGSSLAAPQFEGIKNLFSSLAGGDTQEEDSGTEKVPYTTLKQFDVSSVFYFFLLDDTITYNDC